MTEVDDRVLRVGVAGCGYWGRNLVRNFRQLGALAAVCDADRATAEAQAAEHGVDAVGFDALVARDDVDGIAIATPAVQHAEMAKRALEAGKHVFVEKPLALRIGDARELEQLAAERERVLMVGHLLQYHPAFLKLLAFVREGRLGRLHYLTSHRLNLGKVRREENILWSFAPHDISMILALVGEPPESVSATGSCILHKSIADVTTTQLSFPGGETAHLFVSWLHPYKEQRLVVVGDRAMAVFDDREPWASKLVLYPHRIEWREGQPVANKAEGEPIPMDPEEPLRNECAHFLESMAGQTACRTDGAEGIGVLRVLRAAQDAMSTRALVALDEDVPDKAPAGADAVIHETACVDEGCEIGAGTRVWHFTHVIRGSRIGARCSLGQNVVVGPDVTIGDGCKIQNNVSVYTGVTLEDDVFCGPSCVFTNVMNPRAAVVRKDEYRPTLVRRGATIGANATIVCGATLGEHSFIAAGAVVTGDVPAFALMAGVPAERKGWMSHDGERLGEDLVCPTSGRRYRLIDADTLIEDSGDTR